MIDLFQDLSEKNKEKLLKTFEAFNVNFTKGINIVSYMNRKTTIGIVQSGSLQITLSNYEGEETLLDEIHENDIFGSIISSIMLEDECNITTLDECVITFLDYENITNTEILKSDYYLTFIKNLLKIVSDQMSLKNERILLLTKKNIREKLLAYFNLISHSQSTKVLLLPMSLTNLSKYLSVDRSAMMREIKYLNDDGIIESKGKRITLKY